MDLTDDIRAIAPHLTESSPWPTSRSQEMNWGKAIQQTPSELVSRLATLAQAFGAYFFIIASWL